MNTPIQQIKERSSIVEVAQQLIPGLKQSGSRYVGTIRNEKTPALTIYPETESWYHFADGTGGDVFDLVRLVNNCDLKTAIRWLADFCHITLEQPTPEQEAHIAESRVCEDILAAAARFYNNQLMNDTVFQQYKEQLHQRCFSDESLNLNLVGISGDDGTLFPYLEKLGYGIEQVKKTGLVTQTGDHDFFQWRITFPILKNGRAVYMTGRKTNETPDQPWEAPKYRHLPNTEKISNGYFYNEDCLKGAKEIIIAEGIPDCLTLQQLGFTAMGLLGNSLKDEYLAKLSNCVNIFLALDIDGKGDSLAMAEKIGKRARILTLPAFAKADGQPGKDINEFVVAGHTKEDIQQLLIEAKSVLEFRLPVHLQKYHITENLNGSLSINFNGFTFVISRIQEIEDRGLKAQICCLKGDQTIHSDFITFSYSRSRNGFARGCKAKNEEEIEQYSQMLLDFEQIIKFRDQLELSRQNKLQQPEAPSITDEERQQAENFLKSPVLLKFVNDMRHKLLVAGEERNWLIEYLSITSRLLNNPISVIPKGSSSSGKSYGLGQCLKLFPKVAYVDITDATARSFYHLPSDALKHKMVVLFEKHGMEQTDYQIRSLQSEGKLKLQITIQDPETGEFHTETKEVEGPTGFITTTTDPRIHAENETRNFSLYLDESEDQTIRTFDITNAKYQGLKEPAEADLRLWHLIQDPLVLKTYSVIIPFAQDIGKVFPKKPIRVRRDYGRFLALIEASALLHQYQRKTKILDDQVYLVAEVADFVIAKIIGEQILKETIFALPPKVQNILLAAREIVEDKKTAINIDPTFTVTEIALHMGLDYDTINKWFYALINKGYAETKIEGRGSKPAQHALTGKNPAVDATILPEIWQMWELYGSTDQSLPYDPITGEPISTVKPPDPVSKEELNNIAATLGLSKEDELAKELGF